MRPKERADLWAQPRGGERPEEAIQELANRRGEACSSPSAGRNFELGPGGRGASPRSLRRMLAPGLEVISARATRAKREGWTIKAGQEGDFRKTPIGSTESCTWWGRSSIEGDRKSSISKEIRGSEGHPRATGGHGVAQTRPGRGIRNHSRLLLGRASSALREGEAEPSSNGEGFLQYASRVGRDLASRLGLSRDAVESSKSGSTLKPKGTTLAILRVGRRGPRGNSKTAKGGSIPLYWKKERGANRAVSITSLRRLCPAAVRDS